MSDTPRTDAEAFYSESSDVMDIVGVDFARQLERELSAMTQERDAAQAQHRCCKTWANDARAERDRIRSMSVVEMMCENLNVKHHVEEWEQRCLKAEAERDRIAADNARLRDALRRIHNWGESEDAEFGNPGEFAKWVLVQGRKGGAE